MKIILITDGGRLRSEGQLAPQIKNILSSSVDIYGILVREQVIGNSYGSATISEIEELVSTICTNRKSDDILALVHGDPALSQIAGVDGLHLNQFSPPLSEVKRSCPENLVYGYSCHSGRELLRAKEQGYDYAFLSPIFEPGSKDLSTNDLNICLGIDGLHRELQEIEPISGDSGLFKVFGLGGVSISNIPLLQDSGLFGVAVISSVFGASDPLRAMDEISSLASTLRS